MRKVDADGAAPRHEAIEFFTRMVEKVSDYAIFLLDPKGTICSWNKAAETMKGYAADDVIGEFFGMLYTEEDRKKGRPQHNLDKAAKNAPTSNSKIDCSVHSIRHRACTPRVCCYTWTLIGSRW